MNYPKEMDQYIYLITIINESTVRVQKYTPESDKPSSESGTFRKEKISKKIKGETLFEALFDTNLRKDFLTFYKDHSSKGRHIKIPLQIRNSLREIASYPWELMFFPKRYNNYNHQIIYFATDRKISFFHCSYQDQDQNSRFSIPEQIQEQPKISLAIANQTRDEKLKNKVVQYSDLKEKLENLRQNNKVQQLHIINPAVFQKVDDQIRDEQPHIFHFVGHGELRKEERVGKMAFVKKDFDADWRNAQEVATLFDHNNPPQLVILQACETAKNSEFEDFSSVASQIILKERISFVIAMRYRVSNLIASEFFKEFYDEILEGQPIDIAVQQARHKLATMPNNGYNNKDFANPVLYVNPMYSSLPNSSKEKKVDIVSIIAQEKPISREIYEAVKAGNFCSVLTHPCAYKENLLGEIKGYAEQDQVLCITISSQDIGNKPENFERETRGGWYLKILKTIHEKIKAFNLLSPIDFWRQQRDRISMQSHDSQEEAKHNWFRQYLEDVLLLTISKAQIIIIFDGYSKNNDPEKSEYSRIFKGLKFKEEFWKTVQDFYERRPKHKDLERLNFLFFDMLIPDENTKNMCLGWQVDWGKEEKPQPEIFCQGLENRFGQYYNPENLFQAIIKLTSVEPFLFQEISEYVSVSHNVKNIPENGEEEHVKNIIMEMFAIKGDDYSRYKENLNSES